MRQNRRNTVHPHEVREQAVKLMSELNFTPNEVWNEYFNDQLTKEESSI